jgi:hypothetical protein
MQTAVGIAAAATGLAAIIAIPVAAADPVPTLGIAHPYENADGFGTARPSWYSTGSTASSTVTDLIWDSWGGPQATGHGLVSNGAGHPKLHLDVTAGDLGMCAGQLVYRTVTSTATDDPGSRPFTMNICHGNS